MKKEDLKLVDLGDAPLSDEQHKLAVRQIKQADKEIEQMRMQIKWGIKQVNVIKKAASTIGIPYQTYVKHVLYKQALEDLERAEKTAK